MLVSGHGVSKNIKYMWTAMLDVIRMGSADKEERETREK